MIKILTDNLTKLTIQDNRGRRVGIGIGAGGGRIKDNRKRQKRRWW